MARVTVSVCLSSPSVTSSDLTVGWDVSSWMTRGASVTTSSPTAVAAAAHCRQTTVSIVADHKCLSTFQTNHLSYRTLSLIKDILSSLVTLAHPSTSSSLRITDHSFHYASPRLWSQLPASLRQPRTNLSNSDSPSPPSAPSTHHSYHPSALHSFIPGLKPSFSANPSHLLPDWLNGFPGLFTDTSDHIRFLLFSFFCFHFFGSVR